MINNVLCVDDDEITLMLNKLVIKKAQFSENITEAANGRAALEYYDALVESNLTDKAPCLILLDINMPVLNGWEFLDNFMKNYYEKFSFTKVAMLSSTVNPEDFNKAKEYEIVIDFLTKPLNREQLDHITEKLALVH